MGRYVIPETRQRRINQRDGTNALVSRLAAVGWNTKLPGDIGQGWLTYALVLQGMVGII